MLIPRFSIRWILAFTVACAVVSFIVAHSIDGNHWAMAVTAALAVIVGCFLLFAVTFLMAYGLTRFTRFVQPPEGPKSPFASQDQLPRQLVPRNPYSDEQ